MNKVGSMPFPESEFLPQEIRYSSYFAPNFAPNFAT